MLGGFAAYYLFAVGGLNYVATLVLAVLLVGLAGVVAERLVFRHLRGKTLNAFIVSLGLLWVLQATAQLSFGVLDKSVPSAVSGIVRVGGVIVSRERLFVILTAVALIIGLYLFLKFTRTGQAMRAVAQDAEAAALQGVNIELTSALGFGIGCALAGAAGALLAPIFAVSPTMGALPVVKAFIIIIVGGMGSLPGAVLGGLLLGAVEGVGTLFMSSAAVNILGFLMVIAILLLRPRGLLGAA
jgi:branched-chain amino acid transport system permease protein